MAFDKLIKKVKSKAAAATPKQEVIDRVGKKPMAYSRGPATSAVAKVKAKSVTI